MDFSLTEEQEMLKKVARNFLEKNCPSNLVREMEEEKDDTSKLWRQMAELGWMGLLFPAKYGGSEGNFLDLVILLEELGRALAPVPFVPTMIVGLSILSYGTEKQKQEFLPKITRGDLILTLAWTELEANYEVANVSIQAVAEGDEFVISGTKFFVPYGHAADYLLCVTRSRDEITPLLVERKAPGISYTLLRTTALDKQYEVVFAEVKVQKANMLGRQGQGGEIARRILEQLAIAECALMVGGAERVLEMSVKYAKERVQFDRAIGSFQAIQHRCADMMVDLDGARLVTYEAAWKLSQGFPCALEVSVAKGWVNQAYQRICASGHQVHGGIGVIMDHDMQLYSRRAKASEFMWGDTDFHRELVAQELGL
jgi:alkylation response protein AidB-like acyl-CoA dehydrogenase